MVMADGESSSLDRTESSPLDRLAGSLSSPMDSLGKRLGYALKLRAVDAPWLIKASKLSKQGIYNILNDTTSAEKIRASTVDQICGALQINKQWLLDGRGPVELSDDIRDQEWAEILGYRTAAALGDGAIPDDYAETHKLKFRADSLQRKRLRADRLGVCYGRGDSMLPRIKSGDAILFDMGDTEPRDGALFVVTYDGNLMAKQLTELGGRWFIESLNREDPKWRKPQPIDEHKGFQIHGRVRWIGSWED